MFKFPLSSFCGISRSAQWSIEQSVPTCKHLFKECDQLLFFPTACLISSTAHAVPQPATTCGKDKVWPRLDRSIFSGSTVINYCSWNTFLPIIHLASVQYLQIYLSNKTVSKGGNMFEWLEAQIRNLEAPGSSPLSDH